MPSWVQGSESNPILIGATVSLEGKYSEYTLSEAVIEYFKNNSPVKPKLEGRIKKVVGGSQ